MNMISYQQERDQTFAVTSARIRLSFFTKFVYIYMYSLPANETKFIHLITVITYSTNSGK